MKNLQKKLPTPSFNKKDNRQTFEKINQQSLDFSQVNYVHIQETGQRLDNFLLSLLKGVPRSHIYKMIRDKEVVVNKKKVKAHERLGSGDVVRIAPVKVATRQSPIVSAELASALLARTVYEDDGLIVLDKPAGMAVHGGSGVSYGVIEALRVANNRPYLELVHRIDKETSGLLLIAKKRSTLKAVQEQFREKRIKKDYLCLCLGVVKKTLTVIDKPLLKYNLENGERRVKVHVDGKPSQTKIEVLTHFECDGHLVSLVKASPLTGRTHQIRVHLASVGHPLLGDDKYLTVPAPSVRRLCLHAWRLMLGERQFVAKLPEDMTTLLAGVWTQISE